jgi:hypothetical protein
LKLWKNLNVESMTRIFCKLWSVHDSYSH